MSKVRNNIKDGQKENLTGAEIRQSSLRLIYVHRTRSIEDRTIAGPEFNAKPSPMALVGIHSSMRSLALLAPSDGLHQGWAYLTKPRRGGLWTTTTYCIARGASPGNQLFGFPALGDRVHGVVDSGDADEAGPHEHCTDPNGSVKAQLHC